LTVTFNSDFSTAGGPDVHVFLSNSFTAPNDNNPDKLEIGSLQSTSGAQTYTVPAGVAIDDYNWLLIHCITYNHFWGGGEFGMMEGNCVTTGIDTPDETDPVIIFSSNGILTIQNIPENTHHIAVFNLFGQQLLSQSFANGIPTSLLSYPVERPDEFIIVRISTPEKEFSYKVLTH
ncbi:MAG TPA: DM13 domain-containing protein, partial [Chitinophagales bacterium]|nr:DM13 domain-containing protein [Chitinophagales bacterium]